jgi:hypothetical protein
MMIENYDKKKSIILLLLLQSIGLKPLLIKEYISHILIIKINNIKIEKLKKLIYLSLW